MSITHPATIRSSSEGVRIGIVGDTYRLLATGADTDGRYAMIDALVPPGGGPPPHVHSREEEAFLVLEGELQFQLGDQRIDAGPGTFLNMPIGSLHSFRNVGEHPARMIITLAPAGLEEMFVEIGRPLAENELAGPPSPEEIGRLVQAASRYGIELMLPPH